MRPPIPPESLISCLRSKVILNEHEAARIVGGSAVVVFNTESIYHYFTNPDYRSYVAHCSHVAIDGIGLKLALRLFGVRIERYHGPELLQRIIDLREQWSIAIAGGSAANRQLVERGMVDHYFDLTELIELRGKPLMLRRDNGPELSSTMVYICRLLRKIDP
jgi:UDP-N-acetyl-D-mannosaminuronic acid transferase (WecB/TagA/CpsF family)